jgi:ABC-type sugar transport system permease subunit
MSQQNRSNRRRSRKSLFVRIVELVIIILVLVGIYFTVDFAFKQWDREAQAHDAAVQQFRQTGFMPEGYDN